MAKSLEVRGAVPCYIPPSPVRMACNVLGIGAAIIGTTLGILGLTCTSRTSLAFWVHKTVKVLKKNGCIGLIFGSYVVGTVLTQIGNDPLHSKALACRRPLSARTLLEIATRIPRLILSLFFEFFFLIPYACFLLSERIRPSKMPTQLKPGKGVIVFIHGSNCNAGIWNFWKPFLNKKRGTIITVNLEKNGAITNTFSHGIEEYAAQLAKELAKLKHENGDKPEFTLVTHSMGGLVAMDLVQKHAGKKGLNIKKVIAIAPPAQGSPILPRNEEFPKIYKPKRLKEMTEGNKTLLKLNECVKTQPHIFTFFGSSMDFLVPAPYSYPSDPKVTVERTCLEGHLGIVALPFVRRKVCKLL